MTLESSVKALTERTSPMKIEVWSDVYCPFCYIAEARLEKALAKYQKGDQVELVFRSFELDPSLPVDQSYPARDYLALKYQLTQEQAQAQLDAMTNLAKEEGLDFRFDQAWIPNSRKSHALLHAATEQGLGREMVQLLFQAHFTRGLDLGQDAILKKLAQELGLDGDLVAEALESEIYWKRIEADQEAGLALGIQAVPFILFDGRFSISGAQPQEVFEEALEKAFGLEAKPVSLGSADMTCGFNGCSIE